MDLDGAGARRVAAALRLQEADWATPGTCFPQYAYAEDPDGDHFFAPPSPRRAAEARSAMVTDATGTLEVSAR